MKEVNYEKIDFVINRKFNAGIEYGRLRQTGNR